LQQQQQALPEAQFCWLRSPSIGIDSSVGDTLINRSGMAFGGWYVIVWVKRKVVAKGGLGQEKKLPGAGEVRESRSDCFLAFESVFDKVQGCLAGRRQQPVRASLRASCAARPSSPPSTRCAREELDEINVFVNVFDKVAPENREARRGRGRLRQGRARGA